MTRLGYNRIAIARVLDHMRLTFQNFAVDNSRSTVPQRHRHIGPQAFDLTHADIKTEIAGPRPI